MATVRAADGHSSPCHPPRRRRCVATGNRRSPSPLLTADVAWAGRPRAGRTRNDAVMNRPAGLAPPKELVFRTEMRKIS
ncbi:hypothetical protein QR680_009445 [Steinernema hermaphroditum]|uniref:Uncharacterized protein n=1 Tax=Steinernema hermaphroditum TaxID=289476 RepID=A0AA39M8V0_9BILA|nr:hypothetical protein QR680_009445 [Steinernema hermaphroditum]